MKAAVRKESEIELIRQACLLVSHALAVVGAEVQPGVAAARLDRLAEEYIRDHGATPAFKGYQPSDHTPFPHTLCISVNHEVVHGLSPSTKYLQEGDMVSLDCGVKLNGYYGDSAYTFAVGEVSPAVAMLMQVTKESLYEGIAQAVDGNRVGDVAYAVQSYVEARGYSVVREMVGHGLGTKLHEPPEVPNYGKRRDGPRLHAGNVIAIEPMINLGKKDVHRTNDGWTIVTKDGKPSAHYEHTVVIRRGKAEILTTFAPIEKISTPVLNPQVAAL